MFVRKTTRPRTVTLGDGRILTMADLPSGQERWVARRKAVVVEAITHGLLARDEAIERYGLTEEELDMWIETVAELGPSALKIKSIPKNRVTRGIGTNNP
ncbi:MAG TPA: DUF1153 domain-containing protein [Paracoccus sp.]|nr:DUF1153 domain-containing protein [Paracoccus sp. (in: a-proteobacteria)]